jgi:Fe-S-cluster containining protein
MKLHILEDQNFSCRSCARCCRDLHVELSDADVKRLAGLGWPSGHPLHGATVTQSIGGRTYIRHTADGACLYFNPQNQLCRIHEIFGAAAKPTGCQVFPFQFAPGFDDEITVTGRYYCPTVRRNEGVPHSTRRVELTTHVKTLGLRGGLTQETLRGLSRQQVENLIRHLLRGLDRMAASDERALMLYEMARWLQQQPPDLVQEMAIQRAIDESVAKAQACVAQASAHKLPGAMQLAMRGLLTIYLRRDDEVADKLVTPWQRMKAVAAVILGRGNLRGLGRDHPDTPLANVPLFTQPYEVANDAVMDAFWDMVRVKLRSMQFVGRVNFNRDLVAGLRSLVLLQPLVVLTAKAHSSAAGRGVCLNGEDVNYAVAEIEHAFGRQRLLDSPLARYFEALLLRPDMLPALLLGV